MAKKQTTSKSDTTKVAPRFITTPQENKASLNPNKTGRLSDTTRAKNAANYQANSSLAQRNSERVKEGKKLLPKPAPTLYAKDLPKKKK